MCVKLGSEQMVIVVMHLRQVIYRKDVTKDRDLFLCSSAQSCIFQIFSDVDDLKTVLKYSLITFEELERQMCTKETSNLKVSYWYFYV